MAESFYERRGLLGTLVAGERTWVLTMQPPPPAAGLHAEGNVSTLLELRVFYTSRKGKQDVSGFERVYIGYG